MLNLTADAQGRWRLGTLDFALIRGAAARLTQDGGEAALAGHARSRSGATHDSSLRER